MSVSGKAKHLVVLLLAIAVASSALFYREERQPQKGGADRVNLSGIPAQIGSWNALGQDGAANTKESAFLNDVIYRTYRRGDGKTMVLAVAYGADQRKKFNLHLPELCYKASGFSVLSLSERSMHAPELKLRQMMVRDNKESSQQIQYWMILGGRQVTGEFEKRLKHLYYSVLGVAAEGVLVRVSSFSSDKDAGSDAEVQQQFIASLYQSVNPGLRKLLFGNQA